MTTPAELAALMRALADFDFKRLMARIEALDKAGQYIGRAIAIGSFSDAKYISAVTVFDDTRRNHDLDVIGRQPYISAFVRFTSALRRDVGVPISPPDRELHEITWGRVEADYIRTAVRAVADLIDAKPDGPDHCVTLRQIAAIVPLLPCLATTPIPKKLASRCLKLPSHLLNPENSLNETVFGTAR